MTSAATKSASPNTSETYGHNPVNPHTLNPDTALSCVKHLAQAVPKSSAMWKKVMRVLAVGVPHHPAVGCCRGCILWVQCGASVIKWMPFSMANVMLLG